MQQSVEPSQGRQTVEGGLDGGRPGGGRGEHGLHPLEQGIGPGQRLVGGKYTLYISMKDAATATNTETISVFSGCGGFSQSYNIPITNAWPSTAAQVFTVPIDLTPAAGPGCTLGMRFWGATTADQIQVGYVDFAPVAEQLNAQTINATTINLPGGITGGNNAIVALFDRLPKPTFEEQVAGIFLLQAKDLDEAIGIASRIPSAKLGTVEVRPLRPLMIDGRAHWCMERISAALGGRKS